MLFRSGVVEGRDIGSVVFPDATLKVYLVATPLVRAKRRVAQHGGDVEEIARAIAERDERDSTRDDSPLRQMPDAVVVDTSDRSVEQVIEEIRRLLQSRLAATGNMTTRNVTTDRPTNGVSS